MGGADSDPLNIQARDSSVRPRSDRLRAGSLVTANVRLVRELSVGGMGSIWLAHHLGLETDVAVKLMAPELTHDDPEFLERFRREAALSARIRSVHVVQIFDHGVTPDGTPYLVMELLEGKTLAEVLDERGRLDLRTTARIVAQLAKALHAVHVHGIVHRDLKPDNVFLVAADYEVFAKLLDFGIAKQTLTRDGEITKTGMGIGTPGYVAPEQAMNAKSVDHRADLWSLGALAYRALTGALPFGDGEDDTHRWLVRLFRGELSPATSLEGQLPPAIDEWFAQALHGVPDKRFATARAMAEAFVAIAARASAKVSNDSFDDEPWAPGEVRAPIVEEEEPPSARPRPWTPITMRLPEVESPLDEQPDPPTTLYRRPEGAATHDKRRWWPWLVLCSAVAVVAGAFVFLGTRPEPSLLDTVMPRPVPVVPPLVVPPAKPTASAPAASSAPLPRPLPRAAPPIEDDPWSD